MKPPTTHSAPGLAVLLKITSVALFTAMAALVKVVTETVPAGEAVFFRSLLALPVIVIWIWQKGELREALVPRNTLGHVWRGLFGTAAMASNFAALGLLPLPEVTAIGYAAPIFTIIFAVLLLGERIRFIRITAVILGLVGVLIVAWPRLSLRPDEITSGVRLGVAFVLASCVLRALVQIHIRTLVKTEHTAAIVFYFSLTSATLSLFTIPFGWVMPDPLTLFLLCMTGILGGIAQILVTSAYRFGAASMLAPYDYASLIFAITIGYVFFSEVPTLYMLLGALLVIAGNVLVLWRERQLGLINDRARAARQRD
ncbi:DMT family transporter [Marinibacterium sp. SX1]|uniref:DMT family transporter n=1 Tax=Marinibacterium sp. SX1 TaxID=3388424 RepID=UPI003D180784